MRWGSMVLFAFPHAVPFNFRFSVCLPSKLCGAGACRDSGQLWVSGCEQLCLSLADLTNIFESFLPQLLAYPNPIDPLNGDAAAMYLHRPEEYKQKIKGKGISVIVTQPRGTRTVFAADFCQSPFIPLTAASFVLEMGEQLGRKDM